MLFSSGQFICFFTVTVLAFYLTPARWRWALLLPASYLFYMAAEPVYALLIALTTLVDYCAARMMARSGARRSRRGWLLLGLCVDLGLLFTLKYFNFFAGCVASAARCMQIPYRPPELRLLLTVGVSFYTFKSLAYLFDVYSGKRDAERHLGRYALYVSFFPQLLAGPIERSDRLLPQLEKPAAFSYRNLTFGLQLMLWGYFKKLVIADRCAPMVAAVFDNPGSETFRGIHFLTATVLFAIQIYCDFSGYSDIAIGAGRAMGFRTMKNFDRPYGAHSLREFWRRWHISLSSWFRDYVYIPLGGNRVRLWRQGLNVVVTFLLSGLWHGANWTFITWGLVHGALLMLGTLTSGLRERVALVVGLGRVPRLWRVLQVACTFMIVTLAWVFFRARSMSDALYILSAIPRGLPADTWQLLSSASDLLQQQTLRTLGELFSVNPLDPPVLLASIVVMQIVQAVQGRGPLRERLAGSPVWVRWSLSVGLILWIMLFGKFGHSEFIYMQF